MSHVTVKTWGDDAWSEESTLPNRLNDAFLPGRWFVEFEQTYADGITVLKRGLEASRPIILKHNLAIDEVIAFTTHEDGKRAMTAFHFHPGFPMENRRSYMRAHDEGVEVVLKVAKHLVNERAKGRARLRAKAVKQARAVGEAFTIMGTFLRAEGRRGSKA